MRRKCNKKPVQSKCNELGMMDKVLIAVGVLIVIFTITMVVTFYQLGAIPDTLCTCVFGACTGEAGFMGIIQATKNKYRDREWMKEDRAEMQSQDVTDTNAGDINENEAEG